MYILDTNILIHYLQGNQKVITLLNNLCQPQFSVSIITRFELLIGAQRGHHNQDILEQILDQCSNISMDKKIVKEALKIQGQCKNKLKFKDLIIAATAKTTNKTLITSDKDFKRVKDLKVEYFKSR